MKYILCILFGHIWKVEGDKVVCARCGAVGSSK